MSNKRKPDMLELMLKAHREGVEQAIDLSARTGIPLVIYENGKIKRIKAPYKYVRVPVKSNSKSSKTLKK